MCFKKIDTEKYITFFFLDTQIATMIEIVITTAVIMDVSHTVMIVETATANVCIFTPTIYETYIRE